MDHFLPIQGAKGDVNRVVRLLHCKMTALIPTRSGSKRGRGDRRNALAACACRSDPAHSRRGSVCCLPLSLLAGSASAPCREESTGSGLGDPALSGAEGDAADPGHCRCRVRVSSPGEPAMLEGDEFVEIGRPLRIAERPEQIALGNLAAAGEFDLAAGNGAGAPHGE